MSLEGDREERRKGRAGAKSRIMQRFRFDGTRGRQTRTPGGGCRSVLGQGLREEAIIAASPGET